MLDIPLIMLITCLVVAIAGIIFRVIQLLSRFKVTDPSLSRNTRLIGIIYSFTIGMLPWKKESAKLHWIVYLRGIFFHLGIFAGIVALVLSVFPGALGPVSKLILSIFLIAGTLSGIGAVILRLYDVRLRSLSKYGDYISPILVIIFSIIATFTIDGVLNRGWLYITTSIICLYLPWSKLYHAIYFFCSRITLGALFSRRGFLGKSKANLMAEGTK